jgi:hypothetical protein
MALVPLIKKRRKRTHACISKEHRFVVEMERSNTLYGYLAISNNRESSHYA